VVFPQLAHAGKEHRRITVFYLPQRIIQNILTGNYLLRKVLEGLDVIDKIRQGDKSKKIIIHEDKSIWQFEIIGRVIDILSVKSGK